MLKSRVPSDVLFHGSAFQDAPLALFTLDEDSVVTAGNLAFAKLCSVDASRASTNRLKSSAPFVQLLEAVREGPSIEELELSSDDGVMRRCTALLWSVPPKTPARLYGVVLLGDTSREAEDARALSAELDFITNVSGTIAHDLNNLLTVIMSVGELTMMSRDLSSMVPRMQSLIAATLRAACLSTQLTQLTHRPKPAPVRAPAEKLVQVVVQLLQQLVPELTLAAHAAPECGFLRLDLDSLAQIAVQLVLHLRDSLPPECQVALCMRPVELPEGIPHALASGAYVELALGSSADEACQRPGLALELLQRAELPIGPRSGLGLTSAQDIVAHMGGYVGLLFRGDAPPLFVVYLPQDA